MKRVTKKFLVTIAACALFVIPTSSAFPESVATFSAVQTITANAAMVRKCYTITTSNTSVYSNTGLTSKIGSIFPTDEIVVNDVTSKYTKVTYPIANGRTKTGYIATSAILTGTSGKTYTARGKCTTYIRANTSKSYGSIFKNDSVTVLGTKNGMVQVKYPVSGGYKYAFVTQSDANAYILPAIVPPMPTPTVYKQSGQQWSSYKYGWYYDKNGKKVTATIGSSGCGIVSLTNAVKYLNGNFINPTIIAKYSLDNGYRINNVGTSHGLYKSFCNNRGNSYNIKYVGYTSEYSKLRNYLVKENVAIINIPNHIMACVAYSNGKYLVLDSSPNSNRGTSNSYAWKTEKEMKNMGVSNEFYIIGKSK